MSALKLRPYQEQALRELDQGWEGGLTRLAVVLPTGMGKTVIFAHLVDRALNQNKRPLILVHRDELVRQAADKIRSVIPGVSLGIVKAASRQYDADVVIASVQTLGRARRREEIPPETFGLVIVDECHHAAADSYMNILRYFGCFTPLPRATRAAGFTATMSREDKRGLGDVWEDIVYEKDILYGIGNGYLCDVKGVSVTVDGLDLGEVARTRGDYQDGALGEALESCGAGKVIAGAYNEHAAGKRGILFAPTVATAASMAEDFNDAGIVTQVVTGATPVDERAEIYEKFRSGATQVLSNCMVLTEGFDAPHAEVAVIARPTSSQSLYVQMAGRVLRPYPGKPGALILDVMGVSSKLVLAGISDLSTTEPVSPRDGETLMEAARRAEKERREREGRQFRSHLKGDLKYESVDLFGSSRSVWLQTPQGVWFIQGREVTWFLWPDDGDLWKIGRYTAAWNYGRYQRTSGSWIKTGLTLEYAMAWAEQEAETADPSITQKSASWRKRKAPASDAQKAFASRLGIDASGMTKNEVAEALSIATAMRILDVN